jgi:hypothetical protein
MTSPHWTQLGVFEVAAKPDAFWTLAVEYVPPSRLLRFQVIGEDKDGNPVPKEWQVGLQPVGANGLISNNARTPLLSAACYQGALIGKLGGSCADVPDTAQTASPWGTKRVFTIGSFGLIFVAAADAGPLYMTINDEPKNLADNAGSLWVQIDEAPM